MENKKGIQLSEAFGAVLTLVLVATLVIISIVIFVNLSTSFAGTLSATTLSESITPPGSVANASLCGFGDFSLTSATNSTGALMTSGNYTTTTAGVITNTTALTGAAKSPWIVNYTYTWGSGACTSSNNLTTEFSNYTSLIGLVGTIIFLGLVIGILVVAFAFGGRKV